MVFKKKKRRCNSFRPNDPHINRQGQPSNPLPITPRTREPKSIFDSVSAQLGGIPPGSRLRPCKDEPTPADGDAVLNSQNWLVDENKLFEATNHALQSHGENQRRRGHVPKLLKHHERRLGFGVQISFRCGFRNCQFVSQTYDLFIKSNTGGALTNVQVGVGLSKTDLTAKSVETFSTTLNLHPPNLKTLQQSCERALACTEQLSEAAMRDNRREVTTTLRLRGETEDNHIPIADVALDGQFSNRSYHCPTGKSDSVSIPVIEQVTGKGLLIQHVNLSHRDGSLPSNTHINSGETLGAKLNYEKTYLAPEYPLHFGVVTTDGDTGLVKSLEAGRLEVGRVSTFETTRLRVSR